MGWTPQQFRDYEQRRAAKTKVDHHDQRLCAVQPKPDERVPLVNPAPREEAGWHDAACCFQVTFIVYSTRPCDWDGYDIKALQDFLVKSGVIPDDGWKIVSGRVLSKKAATEAEQKTVIEIEVL